VCDLGSIGYPIRVSVKKPTVVLVYRRRADSFFGAARDLDVLAADVHGPAIGLLAVHGCIALADAVLISVEGEKGTGDDHAEAARRLRKCCSARGIEEGGVKHFEWLLGRKNHFSYDDRDVRDEELKKAKIKLDQFFAWAFHQFPAVAQLMEAKDA
jgi:hypothetical protein